jgi:hypothetical protein
MILLWCSDLKDRTRSFKGVGRSTVNPKLGQKLRMTMSLLPYTSCGFLLPSNGQHLSTTSFQRHELPILRPSELSGEYATDHTGLKNEFCQSFTGGNARHSWVGQREVKGAPTEMHTGWYAV